MSECKPERVLGPGGLVRDEVLLREINETKPLPPTDIIKLAVFYKAYETNRVLGDHLALIALRQIVGNPGIKQEVEHVVMESSQVAGKPLQSAEQWWDPFEDTDGVQETYEKGDDPFGSAQIRLLPASRGLNYLVETPTHKPGKKAKHYIIGVSPDPASLPE